MAVRGGGRGRGNLKIDHRRLDSAFKVTENETVKYLAFQGKIFEKSSRELTRNSVKSNFSSLL